MGFLVLVVVAVAVVVLVMRAASASNGPRPGGRAVRAPRSARPSRPLAPDDDPEFLAQLDRATRRDDGTPS